MRQSSRLTPLAYSAIFANAALYLIVLSISVHQFLLRHDPTWAFFACEACRRTASSYITWGFMAVGLVALFVRRSEAVLVLFLVNASLLVDVAWGPIFISSHVFHQSVLAPVLHPLLVWAAEVTAGTLVGSALLALPSVRRELSGASARPLNGSGGRTGDPRTHQPAQQGWVLFDDTCGFCRRWIPFWETTLNKRGFRIAPLQSPWVARSLDLPEDLLVQDLRLLLPDGSQVAGANVYRYVMRRIWWAYPLYLLSIAPLLRSVFDGSYRTFAVNRFRISRACHLPGGTSEEEPGTERPDR